jgi:hypothetical protein
MDRDEASQARARSRVEGWMAAWDRFLSHARFTSLAAGLVCACGRQPPQAAAMGPSTIGAAQAVQAKGADSDGDYDLAGDLAEREDEVKEILGDDAQMEVVAGVFLVAGASTYDGFASGVSLTRRAMEAYFNGRFDKRPTQAITVFLFGAEAPYEAFCREQEGHACITPYGYFDPQHRHMVMNAALGLGTLTHELVHPLVDADFPGAPIWINEGIASLFEAPVIPKAGEIHGRKNWRWPALQKTLLSKDKDDAGIDRLFGMTDDTFRGEHEGRHYAMARYFCQWLDERDQLWPFYRQWRDAVGADPTGEKTFVVVVGKSPAAAAPEFRKWLLALE